MKTPSTDLFRIIHSMTSAEKRYFKKDTKDSNTSELFDIINDQNKYNEELVKKKLKDKSFVNNLKVHKNRLQQILLKNLRAYHEEKTVRSKIKVFIDNSEILLKKQLYKLAHTQLEKALKLAEKYEEHELMLLVLGIQTRISSYTQDVLAVDELPMAKMEKCINIIQNYVQHALVSKKILHFLTLKNNMTPEEAATYIHQLLHQEVIEKDRKPISPTAERIYLHSEAMMYNARGDFQRAYENTKEVLRRFEENKHIIQEKNVQYFNSIVNHLTFCARNNKLQELENWIDKADTHAKKYPQLRSRMIHAYNCFIETLRKDQLYEKIIAFAETDLTQLIEEYQLEQKYITKTTLALTLEAYFATDKLNHAKETLSILLQEKSKLPEVFLYVLYILELLFYFEQGEFKLVEEMATTHQKKLSRSNKYLPFFHAVITLFKKISTAPILKQKDYIKLHKTALSKYKEDPIAISLNTYFQYYIWLESKETKVRFIELLETKKRIRF